MSIAQGKRSVKYFAFIFLFLLLILLVIPYKAIAQTSGSRILTKFFPETGASLEQLSAGAEGRGIILYYLPERGLERPSLVVRLIKEAGAREAKAEIYQAPKDLTYVPTIQINGSISLNFTPLSSRPSILITSIDGWWVREGKTSYNLNIQINDPVYAMWGASSDLKFGSAGWLKDAKPGEPLVTIQVRDPAYEGIPKWDWRNLIPTFNGKGYYRTNYAERECQTPIKIDIGVSPLWPYVAASDGFEQAVGKFTPPIGVDWERGKVTTFAELVTVRNQNCSYSLYSITKVQPAQLNQADFETPFAFYDLSGQGKGYPNLILRTETFPAGSPWVVQGRTLNDYQNIRYSWRNAPGDASWDYKVDLFGFHNYNFNTLLSDGHTRITAPSYEQFPIWVVNQDWPAATFVDTEGKSYRSSEGIYEWNSAGIGFDYLQGWAQKPNLEVYNDITTGFRGEYRFNKNLPPRLYFSPIDNRLHLLGADGGVWSLANSLKLEVKSLDGSPYINSWGIKRLAEKIADNGTNGYEDAVYALNGYLIYSGTKGVKILKSSYQPSIFETLPPFDKQSWQNLQKQLASYQGQKRSPEDLSSWLNAFSGVMLDIQEAEISNVRIVDQGYRFVLKLNPNYQAKSSALLNLVGVEPGSYLVSSNNNGSLSIEPLTSPILSASISTSSLLQLQQGNIQVLLHNSGLEDVNNATLELLASSPQGKVSIINSNKVDINGGTSTTKLFQWGPTEAGQWTISARVIDIDNHVISLTPQNVSVLPSQEATPEAVLGLNNRGEFIVLSILIILFLASLLSLIFLTQWKVASKG